MSVPAVKMPFTPTLSNLLAGFSAAPDFPVLGIASDSRQIRNGYLFLACAGERSHGLDYLPQVLDAGAAAIAWDPATAELPDTLAVPVIAVDELATHVGAIADRFYGHPSADVRTIGVTGTNGKTTVAWLIAQCLQHLEQSCGYIGTLGAGLIELQGGDNMTTPAAVDLHATLAELRDQGASYAALEVSSHGLMQGRVDAVNFDTVLFTNLTRDHLDYHTDMDAYFEAKARLFVDYPSDTKIINVDSSFGKQLASRCDGDAVSVATDSGTVVNSESFLKVRSALANELGSSVEFTSSWGDGHFELPIPGDFNVENAMMVLGYLLSHGIAPEKACDVLQLAQSPPGRLQRVATSAAHIYVDYAHTPDALESALRALRPHCSGEIYCVFGCGGDRDRGKRPQMGEVAERVADRIAITTDNPRSEHPAAIIADIAAGLTSPDAAIVIEDRAAAINWAITQASPTDLVLIAGKGHENYQEVAGVRRPFSDIAVAAAAAQAQGADHD